MSESLQRFVRQWPTWLVIVYTTLGWPFGIWMLTRPQGWANALGVLLTAHTLIYSAYLIHDCAHHAIFSSRSGNDRLGVLMSWINGACVADYDRLKKKHLRHHADRLDVVTFDYRAALHRAPGWIRCGVVALEWAYVPAVELLMRGMVMADPFSRDAAAERGDTEEGGTFARQEAAAPRGSAAQRGSVRHEAVAQHTAAARRAILVQRVRVVWVLVARLAFFAALAWVAPKAVLLYALAYLLFLTVLRFMDAFQHTYDVFATRSLRAAAPDPRRDLRYEYENTYSNLLTERWAWLNLLVLNFPYHNAHHVRPSAPWHRLPTLHRTLYGARDSQVITCRHLLASYHRHRMARVLAENYGTVSASGDRVGGFLGAVGVSFLTAV